MLQLLAGASVDDSTDETVLGAAAADADFVGDRETMNFADAEHLVLEESGPRRVPVLVTDVDRDLRSGLIVHSEGIWHRDRYAGPHRLNRLLAIVANEEPQADSVANLVLSLPRQEVDAERQPLRIWLAPGDLLRVDLFFGHLGVADRQANMAVSPNRWKHQPHSPELLPDEGLRLVLGFKVELSVLR